MLPLDHPDRIQITFDDHRLVANAGLILPTTLARHLGLPQLVQECLDLGNAPGRANTGDKIMTLVASALAGGDCIDDADVLRTGGTARTLGGTVKAPSTLGTFLRSFRWGHVRQLDRVSRELAPLLVAQLGWPAGWLVVAQGWDASPTGLADPLAYRASGDTQGRSHILLFPALLDQLPSPQPAGFLPIGGCGITRYIHEVDCLTCPVVLSLDNRSRISK